MHGRADRESLYVALTGAAGHEMGCFGLGGSRLVGEVFAGRGRCRWWPRLFVETTADQRFGTASPSHGGHRSHPRLRYGPHLMEEKGHKPHNARRHHHIGAAEGPTAPAAALM